MMNEATVEAAALAALRMRLFELTGAAPEWPRNRCFEYEDAVYECLVCELDEVRSSMLPLLAEVFPQSAPLVEAGLLAHAHGQVGVRLPADVPLGLLREALDRIANEAAAAYRPTVGLDLETRNYVRATPWGVRAIVFQTRRGYETGTGNTYLDYRAWVEHKALVKVDRHGRAVLQ